MANIIKSNHSYTYHELMGIAPWIPKGQVLDIGCGPGQIAVSFAKYGLDVTALDVHPDNIENNYRKYGDLVDWQIADIRSYPLKKNYYSAIICMNVLPFIPDDERKQLVTALKAALKPGGIMIISGFNRFDSGKNALFSRRVGKPHPLPTGILADNELAGYFRGWEIWHNFEGVTEDNHEPVGLHYHGTSELIIRKPARVSQESINWKKLPELGVGSGWRSSLRNYLEKPGAVDFIEIMLDEYFDLMRDSSLAKLTQRFNVIPHGVELSVGSAYGIDDEYLNDAARVLSRCGAPWWSDHLCYTRSKLHKTFSLNPLPPTEEALETVISNIKTIKKKIDTPFLLENVAYYIRPSSAEMSDAEFSRRIAEETDTGILLDVANLYGNSVNLKMDPKKFIDDLPGERVIQVHLAGGRMHKKLLFDTHDKPVWQETWELLEYALKKCNIKAISLERDDGYDENAIKEVADDIAKARILFGRRVS